MAIPGICIVLIFPVAAEAEYSLSVGSDHWFGWGETASVRVQVACQNSFRTCMCRDTLGPNFDVSAETSTYRYYQTSIPSCDTGTQRVNYQIVCSEIFGSDVSKSAAFTIHWPRQDQQVTYDSSQREISSAQVKLGSANSAINEAITQINNAKSYGASCVDASQAESTLRSAQTKRDQASSTLSTANNQRSSCNYEAAKNSGVNAGSLATDATNLANNAKNAAQSAVNDYNARKSNALSAIAGANSAIQSASDAIAEANDLVGKAKSKSSCIDVASVQQRLGTASQSLTSARSAVSSAQSQVSSCNFAQVSAYTDQSKKDAESARSIALAAKQEVVNLLNQYDQKKGNSDVELSNAQRLLTSARAEIDKVEQKVKQAEKLGCIEEIGLAGAQALKAEAESLLASGNEQHSIAKGDYDSCNFDSSMTAAKKSQTFSNQAVPKATAASNAVDKVVEQTQQMRDGIEDQFNKVKNTIDTAENVDSKINQLLVEHPEETLGKRTFSEAKAKWEQGRERVRAAKTDYDKATLDFQGADCSKATGTIQTSAGFADNALSVLTTAHDWITLKVQEAGDCANAINGANVETNQLYFKSEFGRMYMTEVLGMLINVTPRKISLTHIAQLQKDVQQESINVLKNSEAARVKLDEGDFDSCIPLAQSVRNSAVQIRTKTEEAISQISIDIQNATPAILESYADLNKEKKDDIASTSGFVITGSENIPVAEGKVKENDRLIQEIRSASEKLPTLNGFAPIMEQTQAIVTKAAKVGENAEIIDSALSKVNRAFWIGIIIGLLAAALIGGGVYGIVRRSKRLRAKGKETFWQRTKEYLRYEFRPLLALFRGKKTAKSPQHAADIETSCAKCGVQRKLTAGQKFCDTCGERLIRHCIHCGHLLKSSQKFCNKCGGVVQKKDELPKVREETIIKKEPLRKKTKEGKRKKRQ